MERPGAESGDEQGVPRGGKWEGPGGGSGWKVGTREQHGEDGGKQPSLPRWLSTHSPGWKVGTIRERPGAESGEETAPNSLAPRPRSSGSSPGRKVGTIRERPGVESGGAQRLSAHSWAQRLRARAQCLRARAQHSPTRRTQPHNNAHRRARPWLQVGHNPCTTRKDQTSTWGYSNDPRHSVRLVDHTSTRAHAIITGAHAQGALSKSRIPDPSKTQ